MNEKVLRRVVMTAAGAVVALLALAGCSSGTGGTTGAAPAGGGSSSTALKTGGTTLGTVVIDGSGKTVYVYDKDKPNSGMSNCTGTCASQWPAVETTSASPTATGVTGTVGTITGVDGRKQVTLDGRPLYTYFADSSAGDVTGQGVLGIWWAVRPDGSKVTTGAGGSGSGTSTSGGGSGYSK